jgi:LL-diaminopimelate aminotransferase
MNQAERLTNLPPYLFAELDRAKAKIRAEGHDVIDLSIGDPDLEPPAALKRLLVEALNVPGIHRYPSYAGSIEFRTAAAEWMGRRHDIKVDPDSEVVALIGSKEGIAHLTMAAVNPGDAVVVPSPGYPTYTHATILAGGAPHDLPLRADAGFQPDFEAVPKSTWRNTAILFLNYPNNPTSVNAARETYEQAIQMARQYNFLVVNDAAYIDIAPPTNRPISILSIAGAKDVAVEFHSLSKTFNICGWRIGWCAGKASAVGLLKRIKESIDSGAFTAIQHACASALSSLEDHVVGMQGIYQTRRERLSQQLALMGLTVTPSISGFYVWAKLGEPSSTDYCRKLLEKAHVAATPGVGFGKFGEGYIRFSLTAPTERISEAVERMAKL